TPRPPTRAALPGPGGDSRAGAPRPRRHAIRRLDPAARRGGLLESRAMPELRLSGGALDGLELHYLSAGRGPVVVFLHGVGGFAESWRHTLDALAPRHTVVALDLPGFRHSTKPGGRSHPGFFAGAVGGFLEMLGLGSVSLVGHSMGAAVAIAFALARPTRVERLALIGGLVPGFYRLSLPYRLAVLP